MRGDERQRDRIDAAHHHGPAVRQVVGRRSRRRRADHPVTRLHAEVLAADRPTELDHPPPHSRQRDDVVDRGRAHRIRRGFERRELDDAVVAREHTRKCRLEFGGTNRGEEPDAAEVDPDHRHAAPEETVQGAQHRSVTAEHDRDVRRLEILLGLSDAVLLDLLARHQKIDACLARDLLEPLERGPDRPGLAVGHDRRPADGLS